MIKQIIAFLIFAFFTNLQVQGQAIAEKYNLKGIWTDKTYLDNLKSHNSLTELFKDRGTVYNGLKFINDTLVLAPFPRAMDEDWLYYNTSKRQFESRRGTIKITELISTEVIKAEVHFNGDTDKKYFLKVITESETSITNNSLQLHFQKLYRIWFKGTYQVLDNNYEVIDTILFAEQGNLEGFFNNSLYNFFLWDEDTAVLNIEN